VVTGSNALYRREVFDIVGFNTALLDGEDSALNEAMTQRGLSFATVSGLIVRHEENKPLGASLKWLFNIGSGATSQLLRSQQVRQPDLVTAAFVASVALCLLIVFAGRSVLGFAVPLVFLLLASIQHVRSRFYTPVSSWRSAAGAAAVDCVLLTAYFLGRLAGLSALWDAKLRKPVPATGTRS